MLNPNSRKAFYLFCNFQHHSIQLNILVFVFFSVEIFLSGGFCKTDIKHRTTSIPGSKQFCNGEKASKNDFKSIFWRFDCLKGEIFIKVRSFQIVGGTWWTWYCVHFPSYNISYMGNWIYEEDYFFTRLAFMDQNKSMCEFDYKVIEEDGLRMMCQNSLSISWRRGQVPAETLLSASSSSLLLMKPSHEWIISTGY